MGAEPQPRRWLRTLVFVASGLTALVVAFRFAQSPPDGPIDPTWSRTPCARCGMLVGEPAFAAQLHATSGDVRFFDDAGCLLLYAAEHPGDEAAVWFHHLREARWIPAARTGFVPAEGTPMGYGLGAVEASESGAISRSEALGQAQRREASRAAVTR
jgi:copper chaperone NosL